MPFGIIKVSNSVLKTQNAVNYKAVTLGKTRNRKFALDNDVIMIGWTDKKDYAVKIGKVINKNRNFSGRYGSIFQV